MSHVACVWVGVRAFQSQLVFVLDKGPRSRSRVKMKGPFVRQQLEEACLRSVQVSAMQVSSWTSMVVLSSCPVGSNVRGQCRI